MKDFLPVLVLYGPILVLAGLWRLQRRSRLDLAALIVGLAWQLATLPLLNCWAVKMGWWRFAETPYHCFGMPLELYLGWAVLWGGLPVLVSRWRWLTLLVLAGWIDLMVMPLFEPWVQLGAAWLIGELMLLGLAFLPGFLLIQLTVLGRCALWRGMGQALSFGLLSLVVLPGAMGVASLPTSSWGSVSTIGGGGLVVIGALIGISAVRLFARHGGTPLPLDPPRSLVTEGVYSHYRNPMQSAMLVVVVGAGWFYHSWLFATVGAGLTLAYGIGFASWSEALDLRRRYGKAWADYAAGVRVWVPQWHPWLDKDERETAPRP